MIWLLTLAATILLRSFANNSAVDKMKMMLKTRKFLIIEDILLHSDYKTYLFIDFFLIFTRLDLLYSYK